MKQKILSLLVLLIAVSSAWAADGIACTTEDVGKLICTDGTIYATKAEADAANKTAVAVIAYIDTENNKGLALALSDASGSMVQWCTQYNATCLGSQYSSTAAKTDMDGLANTDALVGHTSHTHAAASLARNYNVTRPDGASAWFLPSAGQWQKMIDAAGGFATLKTNAGMQSAPYWTSTECDKAYAFIYDFYISSFGDGYKDDGRYVRSAFEFDIADPSAVEVTTNAETDGDYFTEASFNMPDYDATVGFDIVRDMAQQMTTKVGDAAAGADYRIRLRKDGTKWALADIGLPAFLALFKVHDDIEDKYLSYSGMTAVCDLKIFALDDNDQPAAQPTEFSDVEPGRYVAKAIAYDEGYYIGETAPSNVIVFFQGYEVQVPAKEMITYYKDENLYADQETSADAQLYTVSSVSGTTVTLSDAITIVPAYTAMLVYNPTDLDKTFLLIPTEEQADNIGDIYAGFKGTNEDKAQGATDNGPWNMAANTKYYGCNGNDFVWIKNAGAVAAHRCWIEISTANAPGRLTIVFEKEEATGVNEVSEVNEVSDDSWYDLSGRKLDGEPTEPGVYIKSGKKVVVK